MSWSVVPALVAWLALLAVLVAFTSASQDIVFDAYRTDVSRPEQRGLAAAFTVVGYRVAMLTSGAAALVLVYAGSGFIPALGWQNTYLVMAALMGVGAEAWSLGQCDPASNPSRNIATGSPVTFAFAFGDVGGKPIPEPK